MKKILYVICAAAMIFTGCSKEEVEDNMSAGTHEVIISATPEWAMGGEPQVKSGETRAAVACDRYVIELYSDAAYTTKIDTKTTTDGEFSFTLDRTKSYYALLWADNAAADVYDVANLKAVTLKVGQSSTEAFQGKVTIEGKTATYTVTLNRAVAKVNLKETGDLPQGVITVKYSQQPTFSVADGSILGAAFSSTGTITMTAAASGTAAAPAVLNATQPIYLFAPVATQQSVDFAIQYKDDAEADAEAEFSVTATTQANYNTNIKGHYTAKPKELEWAKGNLVADGAGGCKIGEPTDGGLFFQFGSLVGWSETGDPTIVVKPDDCSVVEWINDWTGDPTTENAATGTGDPCAYYLKEGWRLPTVAEFNALFGQDGTEPAIFWDVAAVAGWEQGGDFTAASGYAINAKKNLRFPAAGLRVFGDGRLENVGGIGDYWSVSPKDDLHGYNLGFNYGRIFLGYEESRTNGYTIRCVRD